MIIIAESALAYWRTPPAIRDLELTPEMLGTEMMPPRDIQRRLRCARRNDGAVIRALRERILTDLKGIPLPITVVTDETQRRGTDPIVTITKSCPDSIGPFAVDLGDGLFVSSPALALAHLAQRVSAAHTMHLMYEMCGLYTLFRPTERARCAERLVATGTPMTPAAYCDATGPASPMRKMRAIPCGVPARTAAKRRTPSGNVPRSSPPRCLPRSSCRSLPCAASPKPARLHRLSSTGPARPWRRLCACWSFSRRSLGAKDGRSPTSTGWFPLRSGAAPFWRATTLSQTSFGRIAIACWR